MKAIIKIVTAESEFTPDQKQIIRRIMNVLIEHDLSVCLKIKKKDDNVKTLKIKSA